VLFSFEPNFRAFTDGTQRLLRNAVFGPAPEAAALTRAEAAARAGQVATARAAAGRLSTLDRPIRVTVAAAGAAETERLLRGYGARFETRRAGARSTSWSPTRAAWPPTSTRSRPTWPGGCATVACRSGRSACARRGTAASAREARVAA
jgi:hypothetical protein